MKLFSGTRLYSVVILALLAVQLCSSTLLAGTMFYYLMGNYFTRTIFPSAVGSLFRTMVNSQRSDYSDKTVNHYIISQNGSHSVLPLIHSEPSTLESMVKLAKAIGLDQRMNNYVKEAFPEIECPEGGCKKNKKKKKTKKEKKQKQTKSDKPKSDEDKDSDEEDFSKPTLTASEEMAGYTIFGEDEDDILTQADEELADEDPFNFYFIMQDRKRRAEREKHAAQDLFFRNEPPPKRTRGSRVPDFNRPDSPPPPPRESRNPDINRPNFRPDSIPPYGPRNPDFKRPDFRPDSPPPHGPRNPDFNGPDFHQPPPESLPGQQPFPVPRRGVLPIFIRYKVKPNQPGPVPNMPPMHSPDPNSSFLFRRRTGQQQQSQTKRPLSLFNALNQVAANVLTKQILLPVPRP